VRERTSKAEIGLKEDASSPSSINSSSLAWALLILGMGYRKKNSTVTTTE
jgi:hypothetical protein